MLALYREAFIKAKLLLRGIFRYNRGMKFVILHGTDANHTSNWFPWLKTELESRGHEVWVPDLPDASHPDPEKYTAFLLASGRDFSDSVFVGHSSGSLEILSLAAALPDSVKLRAAIMVGSFTERMLEDPSWQMLAKLFDKPFDFEKIKQRIRSFIFVHSEDDPYCPIEQAEYLYSKLGGEFIRFNGMGHFSASLDPRFTQFPELLQIIEQKVLS